MLTCRHSTILIPKIQIQMRNYLSQFSFHPPNDIMAKFFPLRIRQELKSTLFGLILWIPIGVFLLPFYLFLFVIYTLVHKIAKILRPDLIPLTKVDTFLAFAPSNSPSSYVYTCQIWKVKGYVDVDAFRNHFHQQFFAKDEDRKKYVNFYCCFVNFLGYTFKKRVNLIDLNYHIQKLELKKEQTVEQFLGKWMVQHDVDKSGRKRPDWMVKVIPHSDDTCTVILKLHHGLCDGYTMVHLVGKLSGEHAPYMFKEPDPSPIKLTRCLVQFPYLIGKLWLELAKANRKPLVSHLSPNPVDEEWLISFCTLDLQTVKEIRRITGTNFASVLASVQAGALKRLMMDLCTDKEEFLGNVHQTYIGHSMGWPRHPVMTKGGGMGNHLTLGTIKASFEIEDPLERLLDLDKNFSESKSRGYPIISYYGLFNGLKIQPSWLNVMISKLDLSIVGLETAMSTLLCSSNRHYLLGNPVEHLYLPVVTPSPFRKLKLMSVPSSHSGILDVSINASTALVKNQEMLDRFTKIYLPHELEVLRRRIGNIVE